MRFRLSSMHPRVRVRLLDSTGILRGEEVGYTKQVLGAAALTYVAAAAGFDFTASASDYIIWRTTR